MLLPSSNKAPQVNKAAKKAIVVASYQDPYYKSYRQVTKAVLTVVLPLLVALVILWLVLGFLSENLTSQPVATESYVFNSIPVPAGSVAAPFNGNTASNKTINIEKAWVPNYNGDAGSSQAFLVDVPKGEPINWMDKYYQQKLLSTKKWQLQKEITYNGKVAIMPTEVNQAMTVVEKPVQGQALFVQGINGHDVTGLMLDYRLVTSRDLHDYPEEYGPRAKDGQIYLVVTKNVMHPAF